MNPSPMNPSPMNPSPISPGSDVGSPPNEQSITHRHTTVDNTAGAAPSTEAMLSGWGLRAVLAGLLAATIVVSVVTSWAAGAISITALVLVALGAISAPSSLSGAAFLLAIVVHRIFVGAPSIDAMLILLAVLMLAVHQCITLCAIVPATGRVAVSSLLPMARRFVVCLVAGTVVVVLVGLINA